MRTVYEIRFHHDEGYYPLGIWADKDEADLVAARGNALMDAPPERGNGFRVHPSDVLNHVGSEWTARSFVDALEPWDVTDYFWDALHPIEEE